MVTDELPNNNSNAYVEFDQVVFASYGWEEDPGELPDEELLRRRLDLNGRRARAPGTVTGRHKVTLSSLAAEPRT